MNFLELVQKRQSTRTYLSRPVDREKIDRCIDAARLAPSACNSQPWSFVIVDDPEKKQELAENAFSGIYSIVSAAKQAAEEGLGTCWIGWFNEKKVKKTLGLPRTAHVDVLITMGYPADPAVREKNRKTLEEIRRYA